MNEDRTLAIHGGDSVRKHSFPAYKVIGEEEKDVVSEVLDRGVLSKFLGTWHDDFFGGPEVQALEIEWAEYFGVKHAISVNSATSGLHCAVGAVDVQPGEEVIVTGLSMSCSATAPLIFNAIPVFADINSDDFCLDPKSIEEKITHRTSAIIVVNMFGHPHDAEAIASIARRHDLRVIEDNAQGPGATYRGKYAGTLTDVGVFSLNYHKHIHCGEGGIVVTDDDDIADRVRLIRNHAEAVVDGMGRTDLSNLIGFNFRLSEIAAAIARCQLKKLEPLLIQRQNNCHYLNHELDRIPAIKPVKVREHCTHAYYVQPFKFNEKEAGVHRDKFLEAVVAELPTIELRESEGVKIYYGYKPLYLLPMFQNKIAYGSNGCPFVAPWYDGEVNYQKGICPTLEQMAEDELFYHELMHSCMNEEDLDDVIRAFNKVWDNRQALSK